MEKMRRIVNSVRGKNSDVNRMINAFQINGVVMDTTIVRMNQMNRIAMKMIPEHSLRTMAVIASTHMHRFRHPTVQIIDHILLSRGKIELIQRKIRNLAMLTLMTIKNTFLLAPKMLMLSRRMTPNRVKKFRQRKRLVEPS